MEWVIGSIDQHHTLLMMHEQPPLHTLHLSPNITLLIWLRILISFKEETTSTITFCGPHLNRFHCATDHCSLTGRFRGDSGFLKTAGLEASTIKFSLQKNDDIKPSMIKVEFVTILSANEQGIVREALLFPSMAQARNQDFQKGAYHITTPIWMRA